MNQMRGPDGEMIMLAPGAWAVMQVHGYCHPNLMFSDFYVYCMRQGIISYPDERRFSSIPASSSTYGLEKPLAEFEQTLKEDVDAAEIMLLSRLTGKTRLNNAYLDTKYGPNSQTSTTVNLAPFSQLEEHVSPPVASTLTTSPNH